uniref:Uncharacterized protein n=1 Tax=Anguilla anguilla TaxID=7936 RepID=A0A0E9SGK0_ANGAN
MVQNVALSCGKPAHKPQTACCEQKPKGFMKAEIAKELA